MKVVSVVGARPQFIKAAAVSRALRADPAANEVLVHTGQHYDGNMSRVFFEDLDIPRPEVDLEIGSGPHGLQTGRMLEGIEAILLRERPGWVLVYGDTNSTLAGALAAVKLHIPVAHVEAGLRSFNRRMPEEINRVLTDHAADLLLAPTEAAVAHLRREGIPEERIHRVGDVMYDAALSYAERADQRSSILEEFGLSPQAFVLATVHRAENTDDPKRLSRIFQGLCALAAQIPVVLPLHPRTRNALQSGAVGIAVPGDMRLLDSVGYLDMVMLEKNARAIVTDSGGVQKEAYFYRVPCVTVREETEWVELVRKGWNTLAPPISATFVRDLPDLVLRAQVPDGWEPLYGDGRASQRIVELLVGAGHDLRPVSVSGGNATC